jgi:DNA-binding MarR family transcriptional regulator
VQEGEREQLVGQLIALLHQTGEGMNRLAQRMAEISGAHPTDLTAISLLARHPEPVTVGRLGTELQLSKAATTALVDRLEGAGHVHRVRDPSDRRRWYLQVTDSAHLVAESVLEDFLHRTRTALADYSPAELRTAQRFLTDVGAALAHQTDPSSGSEAGDDGTGRQLGTEPPPPEN